MLSHFHVDSLALATKPFMADVGPSAMTVHTKALEIGDDAVGSRGIIGA